MLVHAIERFQWVGPVDDSNNWISRLIRIRDKPTLAEWTPVPIEVLPETAGRDPCDFPIFLSNLLCVSSRALAAVRDLLEPSGEFLTLTGLGDRYCAYHCLRMVDAMNKDATAIALKAEFGKAFATPTFVPTLSGSALAADFVDVFRLPQSFQKIFVSERFVDCARRASLTGLDFIEVPISA